MRAELLDEAETNVFQLNNQLEFVYDLEHNPLLPNRDDFLSLFPGRPPIPEYGLVTKVSFNFREIVEQLESKALIASSFILRGIKTIWRIFQTSTDATFLDGGYPELISLDEFTGRQLSRLTEVTTFFQSNIQETLETSLSETIENQLDFAENREKQVKVQKLVTLFMTRLHTLLLGLVKNTLAQFSRHFEQYLNVQGIAQFQLSPQFVTELLFGEEKVLESEPSLDAFHEKVSQLLDQFSAHFSDARLFRRLPGAHQQCEGAHGGDAFQALRDCRRLSFEVPIHGADYRTGCGNVRVDVRRAREEEFG
jgi:hypothetical protein